MDLTTTLAGIGLAIVLALGLRKIFLTSGLSDEVKDVVEAIKEGDLAEALDEVKDVVEAVEEVVDEVEDLWGDLPRTKSGLQKMTKADLVAAAEQVGVDATGLKGELVDRILAEVK